MAETNTNQNQQTQQAAQGQQQQTGTQQTAQQQTQQAQQSGQAFDFAQLTSILEGRQKANEESVLKGYFKQQGITGEEAAQAIAAFKAEKAKNTPDPKALQSQVATANAAALEAQMANHALLMASELGVDIKTMPYVLRMADLTQAVTDGKVDDEKLKASINQVLEDIPQLKVKADSAQGGLRVGAGTGSTGAATDADQLYGAFNVKKK